jgi:hypothetical protein
VFLFPQQKVILELCYSLCTPSGCWWLGFETSGEKPLDGGPQRRCLGEVWTHNFLRSLNAVITIVENAPELRSLQLRVLRLRAGCLIVALDSTV